MNKLKWHHAMAEFTGLCKELYKIEAKHFPQGRYHLDDRHELRVALGMVPVTKDTFYYQQVQSDREDLQALAFQVVCDAIANEPIDFRDRALRVMKSMRLGVGFRLEGVK